MNRMTPEEIRELMNAVIADPSAEVEALLLPGTMRGWIPYAGHAYDFANFRYRIKPKARVIWVNEWADGQFATYQTKDYAINGITEGTARVAVRYVEQPE